MRYSSRWISVNRATNGGRKSGTDGFRLAAFGRPVVPPVITTMFPAFALFKRTGAGAGRVASRSIDGSVGW